MLLSVSLSRATLQALASGAWLVTMPLLALALAAPGAQAQQIVQYQFTGYSLAPTLTATNSTATSVNFTGSSATQELQARPQDILIITPNGGATSAATAIASNTYFQFTLASDTGTVLNLTSLTFDASNGLQDSGFVLRSSVDGFSTDLRSGLVSTTYPAFTSYSTSLSSSAFGALTSPVTFRLYTFGPEPDQGQLAYDNLTVNGTVASVSAAPEPESLALLLSAGVPIVGILRRRKKAKPS